MALSSTMSGRKEGHASMLTAGPWGHERIVLQAVLSIE